MMNNRGPRINPWGTPHFIRFLFWLVFTNPDMLTSELFRYRCRLFSSRCRYFAFLFPSIVLPFCLLSAVTHPSICSFVTIRISINAFGYLRSNCLLSTTVSRNWNFWRYKISRHHNDLMSLCSMYVVDFPFEINSSECGQVVSNH